MNQSTKAMIIAGKMVSKGLSRSEAMKKAWLLLRQSEIETKVAGVTYENRQKAIQHLKRYPPENIEISLERDIGNLYDSDAVAVVASVAGRGSYRMGYLPRQLAGMAISPILDKGGDIRSQYKRVVGGFSGNSNYGLVIAVSI